jgi:acyl-CoA thioester hydrolase
MKRIIESYLRVRYAETDAQGVVYYANFFVWFEVARVGLLRALGSGFRNLETAGLCLAIVEATCRYLAPAHFDDEITVQAWVETVGRTSFTLGYAVLNRATGQRLAEGSTAQVIVSFDRERRPTEIPPGLRAALLAAGGRENKA